MAFHTVWEMSNLFVMEYANLIKNLSLGHSKDNEVCGEGNREDNKIGPQFVNKEDPMVKTIP